MRGPIFSALSVLATITSIAQAQQVIDFSEVVGRVRTGVVTVRTFDLHDRPLGQGSGFVAPDGRIVTNAHVLEGAARVEVFGDGDARLGSITHVDALDLRADLAVLPAPGPTKVRLEVAVAEPAVGEAILAIGAPRGLGHTVSDGLVSAFREINGRRWLQISAPISEGSSGGPILNRHGQVVGVSVAMLAEGQNINFAVPGHEVAAILSAPRGAHRFPARAAVLARNSVRPLSTGLVELRSGRTVQGRLEADDHRLNHGAYLDTYQLQGGAGDVVTLLVRSNEVDVFVVVASAAEPSTLGFDDDSAGGTNARLTVVLPHDGLFVVGVTTASGRVSGRYSISARIDRARPDTRATIAP